MYTKILNSLKPNMPYQENSSGSFSSPSQGLYPTEQRQEEEKSGFQYTDPIVSGVLGESESWKLTRKINALEQQRKIEISEPLKEALLDKLESRVTENMTDYSTFMDDAIEESKEEETRDAKEYVDYLEDVMIPSIENILKFIERKDGFLSYGSIFSIYSQIKSGRMSPKRLNNIVFQLGKLEVKSDMEEGYRYLHEDTQYKYTSHYLDKIKESRSKKGKFNQVKDILQPIINSKLSIQKRNLERLRSRRQIVKRQKEYLENPETFPQVVELKKQKNETLSRMEEKLTKFKSLMSSHTGALTLLQIDEYSRQAYGSYYNNPIRDEIYRTYIDLIENYPSKLKTVIDHEQSNLENLNAGRVSTDEDKQIQLNRLNRQREERGFAPLEENPYNN
jgi:hypothetical protein